MPDDKKTASSPVEWGTIYSKGQEHTLGGIEYTRSTAWTQADEDDYLARIKEKATAMAASILEEAKSEAENIKQKAHEEGYNQGLAEAQAELTAFQNGVSDSVNAVLSSIEGQCSNIFSQWREEIVGVARLAVEKVTAIEISEERAAMLDALISESVAALETRRSIIIKVNQEDEPVISDIISMAQEKFPDVKSWRVKADASITPGGMVVESESSLVEGKLESRIAAVDEVMSKLVIPAEV